MATDNVTDCELCGERVIYARSAPWDDTAELGVWLHVRTAEVQCARDTDAPGPGDPLHSSTCAQGPDHEGPCRP